MARGQSFRLPPVCGQVIAEATEQALPGFRGVAGEIDVQRLKLAVMAEIFDGDPVLVKLIQDHAFQFAVSIMVDEYLRRSKNPLVLHHREQAAGERRAATAQRQARHIREVVRFKDATRTVRTKAFLDLTKRELALLIAYKRDEMQADADLLEFYEATYAQMELAGLGDEAVVADVVSVEDAA